MLLTCSVPALDNTVHYWCVNTGSGAVAHRLRMDTVQRHKDEDWFKTPDRAYEQNEAFAEIQHLFVVSTVVVTWTVLTCLTKSTLQISIQSRQPASMDLSSSGVAALTTCHSDSESECNARNRLKGDKGAKHLGQEGSVCAHAVMVRKSGQQEGDQEKKGRTPAPHCCCPHHPHPQTPRGDSAHSLSQVDLITVYSQLRFVKNRPWPPLPPPPPPSSCSNVTHTNTACETHIPLVSYYIKLHSSRCARPCSKAADKRKSFKPTLSLIMVWINLDSVFWTHDVVLCS